MYKLEYLPSALRDMTEIARYISAELKSPAAAEKLAEELIEAAERTAAFPYANPVYVPIRQLKREYRKRAVKNYLIFYYVDEEGGVYSSSITAVTTMPDEKQTAAMMSSMTELLSSVTLPVSVSR